MSRRTLIIINCICWILFFIFVLFTKEGSTEIPEDSRLDSLKCKIDSIYIIKDSIQEKIDTIYLKLEDNNKQYETNFNRINNNTIDENLEFFLNYIKSNRNRLDSINF